MKWLPILALLLILSMPVALAASFDDDISSSDKQKFDEILKPVMKIYSFIKYAATVIAVLFLVFAGVTFIISSNDPGRREQAKTMAAYIIVGLIVIWVAPLIVEFLLS
jgi:type IV secretory pathway VirB2 component (pilin)